MDEGKLPGSITDLALTEDDLAGKTTAEIQSMHKRVRFLRAFAKRGIISDGLRAAGVTRHTVLYWRKDPWFEERYKAALEEAADGLEAEAHRRAVEGVDEPVTYQGMPTMIIDPETGEEKPFTVKRYSDQLLITLLKASRPDKFRENHKVQHDVQTGGVLVVPGAVSPEEWAKAAAEQQAKFASNVGGEK